MRKGIRQILFLIMILFLFPGNTAFAAAANTSVLSYAETTDGPVAGSADDSISDDGQVEDAGVEGEDSYTDTDASGGYMVYDEAALFSADEAADIEALLAELAMTSGWNVFAVTADDAQGKSAKAYADDFFDTYSPEKEDGMVFLIDMDNREIWISTCGEAIRCMTDDRISYMLDEAYDDVSDGAYAQGMKDMIDWACYYYGEGIVAGQYNYDSETGEVSAYRSIEPVEAVIAVVLALAAGGSFFGITTGKYKLHFNTYNYAFREYSKVDLRAEEDRFINQVVTHRKIPKENRGDFGRSTTHTSSSGRSHGGGGKSF